MRNRDNIKIGYCASCLQNIHHYRHRRSKFRSIIETLFFGAWRLGPWFCCRCERKAMVLPFRRVRRPTNNRAGEQALEESAERVGNFIRTDSSLVLQQKRSSRYSQKFRDGIVQRLTTGKATISQLCVELKVTESDLIAWINDLLQRRQDRIEELSMILNSYSRTNTHVPKIE